MTKIAGSISQRHGSADPGPPQNVMDPQLCYVGIVLKVQTWHHRAPCWQRLAQRPAGQASAPSTSPGSGAPKKYILKGLSQAMYLAFDEIYG